MTLDNTQCLLIALNLVEREKRKVKGDIFFYKSNRYVGSEEKREENLDRLGIEFENLNETESYIYRELQITHEKRIKHNGMDGN
jgi:hypothetical protein